MDTKKAVKDSKLKEFFVDQLKEIYWAEKKLVRTLPKRRRAATIQHHNETQKHLERIDRELRITGEARRKNRCAAMTGIMQQGEDIIDISGEGTAQGDLGLRFAGQKAEPYQIAAYGGPVSLALAPDHSDAAEGLRQSLEDKKAADRKLSSIVNDVNYQAAREHAQQ